MMRIIIGFIAICAVTACTTVEQREARCKCFNPDGSSTGFCEFTAVSGSPATFSFAANAKTGKKPDC